ncbi:MAG: Hsp70 family protein, partial [Gammaproteobacteria bacterium]|nr:Hsp70 family protein [Gammaproteobacteria bacterium]
EVTFDIDANGILNVSAKDKATGKAQSIVIKASSGLDEGEIERMVKDAEENKESDRKFHDLVTARNQADNMIHACEKSMKELGEELEKDEKEKIEAAITELKEAMKGDDQETVEAKTKELTDASAKMTERVYAKKGDAEAAAATGAEATAEPKAKGKGKGGKKGKKDDDVVDAEFEEVKE